MPPPPRPALSCTFCFILFFLPAFIFFFLHQSTLLVTRITLLLALLRINSRRTSERSLARPLAFLSFLLNLKKARSDACHSSKFYSSFFFLSAAPSPGAESISSSSSGFKKTHQTQSNCRQGNMKITLTLTLLLSVTFASVQAHRRRNSHNNNNSYGWFEVSSIHSPI